MIKAIFNRLADRVRWVRYRDAHDRDSLTVRVDVSQFGWREGEAIPVGGGRNVETGRWTCHLWLTDLPESAVPNRVEIDGTRYDVIDAEWVTDHWTHEDDLPWWRVEMRRVRDGEMRRTLIDDLYAIAAIVTAIAVAISLFDLPYLPDLPSVLSPGNLVVLSALCLFGALLAKIATVYRPRCEESEIDE